MKRFLAIFLALVMVLSLCACGGSKEAPKQETETDNTQTENANQETSGLNEGAIQVDEGLLSLEITLPASVFEEETEESIKTAAEEKGIDSCKVNEDGSVTYKMSKSKHKEILKEMKTSLDESIVGMIDGEDAVASFVKIEYADDFSKFDVYVDPNLYTGLDGLYIIVFYLYGTYYQAFEGKDINEIDVVVNFINNNTNETIESGSYRKWIDSQETAS